MLEITNLNSQIFILRGEREKNVYKFRVMMIRLFLYSYLFTGCTRMKFTIKDFFSKFDQIRRKLWIWLHLLKKSLMENFLFYVLTVVFIKQKAIQSHDQ